VAGAAGVLAWLNVPADQRWKLYGLAAIWLLTVGIIQVLVRREVLRRIDVESDQLAARRIQTSLLPAGFPSTPAFDLAASYSPFREVGGDYYEVAALDGRHWLLAIADVSGKGTSAALLTANLQALVHFAQANAPSLEVAMAAINQHLTRFAPPERFVTMVLGVLDVERRQFRYVNAGHNPPLGLTPDGTSFRLEATGPLLGMIESATYTVAEIHLPPGTTCVFYTDGLVERANHKDEFFGEDRVIASVREAMDERPAAEMLGGLVNAADRFSGGLSPADDTAVLVLRSRL
jgi:sigma-B regulation protein RsbU (phosphoserine phosphatase)